MLEGAPEAHDDASPASGPRGASLLRRAAVPALCVLLAAPLLVLLAHQFSTLGDDARTTGDRALIELYTLRAASGDQLLGPYSRFQFHHPGPLMFYLLAPFYVVLGRSHPAECTGALIINLATLAGLAIVLRRLLGRRLWPLGLAALALYLLWLQPAFLVSVWNPDIATLPLGLALAALAAAASGAASWLPVAAVAGSLAAQSHVACAAPLACATVAAGVAAAIRLRWTGAAVANPGARRPIVLAAVLTAVAWLPVVVEQATGQPGNLTAIVRSSAESHPWQPIGSTLVALATQACGFVAAPFGQVARVDPPRLVARLLGLAAAGLLALLVFAAVRGWRRRDGFALAACGGCVAVLAVAAVEALSVRGVLHPYLLRWVSAVGLLGVVAVTASLARRWAENRPDPAPLLWLGTAVVLVATMLGVRAVLRFPVTGQAEWEVRRDRFSQVTVDTMTARGVRRPHVKIVGHRAWEAAAAVVLQCTKAGLRPTVDNFWLFMFGEPCRFRDADDGTVLVADGAAASQFAAMRGVEPIVAGGDVSVFLASVDRPLPATLSLGELESEVYVRTGFSACESAPDGRFRWSSGPESLLVLPGAPGSPYVLRLTASPIIVPGDQQKLGVEVNGRRLVTLPMGPGWATYSVVVPAELARTRNLIRLRYSVVRSPHELNGSDDRRELAVSFRTLAFARVASS